MTWSRFDLAASRTTWARTERSSMLCQMLASMASSTRASPSRPGRAPRRCGGEADAARKAQQAQRQPLAQHHAPHEPAVRVPENDAQRNAHAGNGVVERRGLIRAAHVAGHPDNEQVPNARVEEQFHGDPRVRARQDCGERKMAPLRSLREALAPEVGVLAPACGEPGVALPQQRQCLLGTEPRLLPRARRARHGPSPDPVRPAGFSLWRHCSREPPTREVPFRRNRGREALARGVNNLKGARSGR